MAFKFHTNKVGMDLTPIKLAKVRELMMFSVYFLSLSLFEALNFFLIIFLNFLGSVSIQSYI